MKKASKYAITLKITHTNLRAMTQKQRKLVGILLGDIMGICKSVTKEPTKVEYYDHHRDKWSAHYE